MKFKDRKIIFHGHHFTKFYLEQTGKVQLRIEHVFRIIRQMERVPEKYLKHLEGTNGLFEIRTDHADYFQAMTGALDESFEGQAVKDHWNIQKLNGDKHAGCTRQLEIPEITLFEKLFIKDGIPIKEMILERKKNNLRDSEGQIG